MYKETRIKKFWTLRRVITEEKEKCCVKEVPAFATYFVDFASEVFDVAEADMRCRGLTFT